MNAVEDEQDHDKSHLPNDTGMPDFRFKNSIGLSNYSAEQIGLDRARVKVEITKKNTGPYCMRDDFAVVSYKGWDNAGNLVFNTHEN